WLASKLAAANQRTAESVGRFSIWKAFRHPNVLSLALGLFFANLANYCFIFWLPASIRNLSGTSAATAAAWSGIPFTFTALCMLGWARSADKTGKRKL